jgi:hypothetical protein
LIHVADEQIRIDAWIAGHNKPQQSEVIPLLQRGFLLLWSIQCVSQLH